MKYLKHSFSTFFILFSVLCSQAVLADTIDQLLKSNACEVVVFDKSRSEKIAQARLSRSLKADADSFLVKFKIDPLTSLYPEFQHKIEVRFLNHDHFKNQSEMEVIVRKKDFVRNWNSIAKTEGKKSLNNFVFEFEEISSDDSPKKYQINCNRLPG